MLSIKSNPLPIAMYSIKIRREDPAEAVKTYRYLLAQSWVGHKTLHPPNEGAHCSPCPLHWAGAWQGHCFLAPVELSRSVIFNIFVDKIVTVIQKSLNLLNAHVPATPPPPHTHT